MLIADYLGTRCAYKEILATKLTVESLERFFEELKLIGKLRHPNIAQCLGVVWDAKERGIMFELCKNGGLDDFMKKYSKLNLMSWKKSKDAMLAIEKAEQGKIKRGSILSLLVNKGIGIKTAWALGIAKGCAFLHAKDPPIIHRDLKSANVLVSDDLTAKITDFGESRQGGDEENTMTTVGTPYFMAPEVFSSDEDDRTYRKEVDIYSFGMLLLEIFYDGEIKKAFRKGWGPMVVMNRVGSGWRPDLKLVEEEDAKLANLIKRCWDHNPQQRPSFMELIKFFKTKQMKLEMETKLMSARVVEEEERPKTLEPENKSKLEVPEIKKRSGTVVKGHGVSKDLLNDILNGQMPEPFEEGQKKVIEEVDKEEGKCSGSGMTMLLEGIRYTEK